jgi:HlyD family secretion protein
MMHRESSAGADATRFDSLGTTRPIRTERSNTMKKTRITAAVVVVVLAAAGFWLYRRADAHEAPAYRTAQIERGDLQATVSATGALSAVTTVQVGTQVSGQVSQILVDFNDHVKKGQLIARIDPTLQQQAVTDAEAGVARARADLDQAQRTYDRNKQLFDAKVLTAQEIETSTYGLATAKASMTSAQVALERARKNLSYTSIYAPIDGIVVERNVDAGQTVAASLSAPQLFLIANDLSRMQILASVDESDIGSIKDGQPVQFSVQTYPNQTFTGLVRQVRLQSTTTENVVNYTVVVEVDNRDGKLLPGMTATVSFLTGSATDAFIVPNAALRFRPTTEMMAQARGTSDSTRVRGDSAQSRTVGVRGDSIRARGQGTAATARGAGRAAGNRATLWVVDTTGKPKALRVRTGLSDGQRTVVEGQGLAAGMNVIVGVAQPATGAAPNASPTANPLQPSRGPGGGGFGRGGF